MIPAFRYSVAGDGAGGGSGGGNNSGLEGLSLRMDPIPKSKSACDIIGLPPARN